MDPRPFGAKDDFLAGVRQPLTFLAKLKINIFAGSADLIILEHSSIVAPVVITSSIISIFFPFVCSLKSEFNLKDPFTFFRRCSLFSST